MCHGCLSFGLRFTASVRSRIPLHLCLLRHVHVLGRKSRPSSQSVWRKPTLCADTALVRGLADTALDTIPNIRVLKLSVHVLAVCTSKVPFLRLCFRTQTSFVLSFTCPYPVDCPCPWNGRNPAPVGCKVCAESSRPAPAW